MPLEWRTHLHDLTNGVGLEEKGLPTMPPDNPLIDAEVELLRQWMNEEAERLRKGSEE